MAEDDKDDRRKYKEQEVNYHIYKDRIPRSLGKTMEKALELMHFYYDILQPFCEYVKPKLDKLMREHYPAIREFNHPAALESLDDTNSLWIGLLGQLRKIHKEYKSKKNVRKLYPKLEEWRAFYCNPKPSELEDSLRKAYFIEDDAEWEKQKAMENAEMLQFFNWEQRRMNEWMEIMNEALEKFYPDIFSIEGDYWVIFAVMMGDEYECWKSLSEDAEMTIDYEMPQESIAWPYKEWSEECARRHKKYSKASQAKRDASIAAG